MSAEKNLGDFYQLFSKSLERTLDLGNQLLQSLQRLESRMKSRVDQQKAAKTAAAVAPNSYIVTEVVKSAADSVPNTNEIMHIQLLKL